MSKYLIQMAVVMTMITALGCAEPLHKSGLAAIPSCKKAGNDKDCKISVKVVETAGMCTVNVDPLLEEIAFPVGVKDKFIYWELVVSKGYTFTEDGIVIEKNIPREFDQPKLMDQGRTFRWKNLHKLAVPKVYYYAVNVTNADGSITCSRDPKINNE